MSLINPAGLVFAVTMLEIEDRQRLCRIPCRRRVDQTDFELSGNGGIIVMTGDSTVICTGQVIPAGHICDRNIHKIHGTAASVSNGQIGAEYVSAIYLEKEIEEAGTHIKGTFPDTVSGWAQRVKRAKAVYDNLMCIFCDNPEMNLSVRQDFNALYAVPVRFAGIGIKGNGNIQRPAV
jgi:hypothetical protein